MENVRKMIPARAMLCVAAAVMLLGISPGAPSPVPTIEPATIVAASATLRRASSRAPIHTACQTLFGGFLRSDVRTPELDDAFVALHDLTHARKSADERVWCLRNIRAAVVEWCRAGGGPCPGQTRPYEPDFAALSYELLTDADPTVRIVGARSAWSDAKEARIMLGRALDDPSPAVRAAMLANIAWPEIAARAAGMPDAPFLVAVDRGVRDPDPRVFTAALGLDVFLRRDGAAPAVRAFATSRDPARRIAAIRAAGEAGHVTPFILDVVENGLLDRDARVRYAALDEIKFPTKRARARLATMMRTAPAHDERYDAKAQLAAFGRQTFP